MHMSCGFVLSPLSVGQHENNKLFGKMECKLCISAFVSMSLVLDAQMRNVTEFRAADELSESTICCGMIFIGV